MNRPVTASRLWLSLAAFLLAQSPRLWAQEEEKKETQGDEEASPAVSESDEDLKDPFVALRRGAYEAAIEGFQARLAAAADPPFVRGLSEALVATGKHEAAIQAIDGAKDSASSSLLQAARGQILLRRGALKEAETSFRKATELKADNVEAWNRLGEALARQGKADEARAAWNKVVSIYEEMSADEADRLRPEDFVEMGLALVSLNRYKEAHEVMFSSARDKDETNPALLLESGRILLQKYNFPDSRDSLKQALEQNRKFADAHVVLAENYLEDFQVGTVRYAQADKHIGEALAVHPDHPGALVARGALAWSDGNIDAAAADFARASGIDPSSLRARGFLAACLYMKGDAEGLKKAEAEALAINPRGAELFHTLGAAIESKFRYKDVVRFCDRALELDPEYWPAYVTLGINCLRTGEEERGRKFLDKSWERDKYNVWVFNTRTLLKHMDANYKELKTDRFVFKFPKKEFNELSLYLVPLIEKGYRKLNEHYKVEVPTPIYIEVFSEHKWFSARTVGLEGFAASGACFGNLVTLTTPRALPQNWGAVAWHEFAHVVALHLTRYRVPRWFTEGLSVFEEGRDHPRWARVFEREIADTYASGRLLPLKELDFGFSKPKYPNQILISYYQGCLIVQYIKEKWGWDSILAMLKGYGDDKPTVRIFQECLGLSLDEFDKGFFDFVARWVEASGYEPTVAAERIPALELAAEKDPKDARKLVDLAWGYLSSGNEVDAPIKAEQALELDPDNGDAHAVIGFDYFRQKNWPKAREALEQAVAKKTRFQFRTHSALGQIALQDGSKEKAIELLEKARAVSPRAGAAYPPGKNLYYQLADLYTQTGNEEAAVRVLEDLSGHAPEDGKCRQRIVAHHMKKDGEESLRKAREALEGLIYINPYEKGTHELLARVAAKLGDHDTTIREYGYLLNFKETNPRIAYLALARAHAAKENRKEAIEYARKVLGLDESNAEAKSILEKLGAPAAE